MQWTLPHIHCTVLYWSQPDNGGHNDWGVGYRCSCTLCNVIMIHGTLSTFLYTCTPCGNVNGIMFFFVFLFFFYLKPRTQFVKEERSREMTKQQTNKLLTEWGCKCNAAVVMGYCRLRRPMVSASAPTSRIRKCASTRTNYTFEKGRCMNVALIPTGSLTKVDTLTGVPGYLHSVQCIM